MKKIIMDVVIMCLALAGTAHPFAAGDIGIHGFASTGYMKSNHNNYLIPTEEGSFEFNEAGINFTASVTNNIRVGMQLYSFDLGDVGNNDMKLDWAFLDYQWKEELGIRPGKFKTPFGLYNELQDYDMLRTSVLLPQSVYNRFLRETMVVQGLGLYGNVSAGAAGTLAYDAYFGTEDIDTEGGLGKFASAQGILKNCTIGHIFGGRIKWKTPLDGLLLSSSFLEFEIVYDMEARTEPVVKMEVSVPEWQLFIFSAKYGMGDMTIVGEYSRQSGDVTITQNLSNLGLPNPPPMEAGIYNEGYYGMISYRFTDWFEAGTYYSVYYPDPDDRDGENQAAMGKPDYTAWQKDWTLSTRFDITDFWLVKLEVHFIDGVALCADADNPDGYEKDWTLFAVKTTFNF
ncbi:hypothetical protein [Desulfonema magnum]|nr:hypothetical protein [Desulfonema magnum]